MKHIGIYILFVSILLVGCSDKYSEELGLKPALSPRYLKVSPTSLSFAANQVTSQSVDVETMETPWKVENSIDWISPSPVSGETSGNVNVGVTENTSGDNVRTGIFFFKSDVSDWEYSAPISVTQAAATPTITLSKSEINFSGTANTETVTVAANCTWSASSSEDWLTVDQKDGTVTLSVTANETNSDRTASVYVVHAGTPNTSTTIKVRQMPASINASTEYLVFNNVASSVDITINAEAAWTATSSNSWVNVEPTSGNAGTSNMKISVSPNTSTSERQANVILSIGENQRLQIPIRQRGIYVETEQPELAFAANGGTQDIKVLSNTNWIVSSVPSWVTVSPNEGIGDGIIKVTADENPNTTNRSGEIHLKQTGLNIDVTVAVTQEGKTFDVSTQLLNFEDKQSTQSIDIQTDGTWQAFSNDSWISVSPSAASGNSTLSISVSENTDDNERIGTVVVTMADKSTTITVIQKGKYFTVSNSFLNYTSKGGVIDVSITSNDSWTAKVEDGSTWLTLSATSGSGDANIKATAADNPSVTTRTTAILFETANSQNVKVVVSQSARFLNVDTREVLFYAKGGTSEPITVSTDGAYKITCSDSWFTVSQSNNSFTVLATENTSKESRVGTITIELTDLKEGTYSLTLSVTQTNKGGSFLYKDYADDKNWDDKDKSDTGTLIITPFDSDKDWDKSSSSGASLTLSGYKTDKNWDSTDGTHTNNLTITQFGDDKNWDTTTSSGTSLTITGYTTDQNLDTNSNGGITVTITGFNGDKNLDSTQNDSGTFSKNGFSGDTDWQ